MCKNRFFELSLGKNYPPFLQTIQTTKKGASAQKNIVQEHICTRISTAWNHTEMCKREILKLSAATVADI